MQDKATLTVDQLLDELPLEVLQEEFLGTDFQSLFSGSLKVLLLTDIGHESVNLVPLLDEPYENTGGVYTTETP